MRRILLATGLAACLAIPAGAEAASCSSRKTNGTVLGAVAGGLLGNAVAGNGSRTGGTLIGAGLGGVVGHQVAKSGCKTPTYRSARTYRGPARNATQASVSCSYENRPFYDERGQLVYAPSRVCR